MAPGRFGVRATHRRTVDGTQIEDYRITALDSATGAIAWQREAYQEAPYWLGSEDGGAYVVHATCTSQPGCVGRQAKLDRVSGVDGSVLWSRAVTRQPLVEQGGRLFTMLASIPVPVVSGHDVVTGSDAWVTPLPPAFTSQVEGAMSADGSLVVKNTTAIGATTRRIEVRGFDPVSGIQRWLLMPTIPNQRTSGGMLVPMTGKTFLATGSLTPTTPGGIGSWLAAIDANSGQFRWEQEMAIGRDSSRTVFFAAPGSERVWLGQRRTSNSGLERHALGTLDPQAGQLGREHQFFSESPDWINGATIPPAPRTLLADGSLLAEARRSRVDGFQLPLMQRWPAPAGASGDIVLELATPSPVLGHGREAFVELRVENRSDIAVADVRVGFAPSGSGQAGRVVDCSAQTGMVQCSVDGEYSRPRLDLGPGAVARVRYAVTSGIYWPARSTDSGSVYFHIDPPYDIGDDLGDNTVEARIWLGGTSNGFE
jgi:outer membrane protein assembly factor BamB